MTPTRANRIEYIDAMRGAAMILVVYFHIAAYGFGSYEVGYNDIIERFRMPAFFFISGWLFFKPSRIWDRKTAWAMIRKKFMVQIIPTAIFMTLYLYVFDCLDFSSLGSDKKGYWFTFVLFEYFVIYILAEALINRQRTAKGEAAVGLLILVMSVTAFYYATCYTRYADELGKWKVVLGLLSFVKIRHIVFFWFGTYMRRHSEHLAQLTDNSRFIVVMLIIFGGLTVYPRLFSTAGMEYTAYLLAGLSGTMLFYAFFKSHQKVFSQQTWIGRSLQFIGRRTLDIYLLHYFVLPYNLQSLSIPLPESDCLIMLFSLVLALLVTGLSLMLSSLIRLSPFLGKYLFGAKQDKNICSQE